MSVLTKLGFQRKTYEDYIVELEALARELFGADINLADYSPIGQWIKLQAYQRATENELAEAVYNAAFIDTAEGISLDYAVKYKSITRFPERASVGLVKLAVDVGLTVDAGLLVGTPGDVNYFTTSAAEDADNDGYIVVGIEAVMPGAAGNVPANTITEVVTPTTGVNGVVNEIKTDGGQDTETDAELRSRYYATTGESSTPEGIATKLLNTVPGVRAAVVIENVDDVADVDGRPPHSFEAIVLGGAAADIGQAILKSKAGGIRSYGSETVIVKDSSNNDQTIGFSYAAQQNVYVNVDISKTASFPTDGIDIIALEIIKYIGGSDQRNNYYAGLGMGDDVVAGKIVGLIFAIPGVADASVTISTDGIVYNANNVTIGPTEVAQTSFDKLVINFV